MAIDEAHKEQLAELGDFISAFSGAELLLSVCVAKMVGVEISPTLFLLKSYGAGQKANLLRSLVNTLPRTDLRKRYELALGRFLSLNDYRNELVHQTIGHVESEIVTLNLKFNNDALYDKTMISILRTKAEEAEILVRDFTSLFHQSPTLDIPNKFEKEWGLNPAA